MTCICPRCGCEFAPLLTPPNIKKFEREILPGVDYMIISRELIMQNRTSAGAWTKAQILALGLSWPPEMGWIDRLDGTKISIDDYKRFCEGAAIRVPKMTRKQWRQSQKKKGKK